MAKAYAAGGRDEPIMAHTRHRKLKTISAMGAKLGTESPAKFLGL